MKPLHSTNKKEKILFDDVRSVSSGNSIRYEHNDDEEVRIVIPQSLPYEDLMTCVKTLREGIYAEKFHYTQKKYLCLEIKLIFI